MILDLILTFKAAMITAIAKGEKRGKRGNGKMFRERGKGEGEMFRGRFLESPETFRVT